MSVTISSGRRAREMEVGARFSIAASAIHKVAQGQTPSEFEKAGCRVVAEILKSMARGESFVSREEAAAPNCARLCDFETLSTVSPALRSAKPEELSSSRLNERARLLEDVASGVCREVSVDLATFLRLLSDRLYDDISAAVSHKRSELVTSCSCRS